MTADPPAPAGKERIARRMARAGLCSRREAERWIAAGRVSVNGQIVTSPALNVGPEDRIAVDDTALPQAEAPRLWRHHKRKGRITSARDPEGRPTVFDDLPPSLPRVITVGRLDFNTEGLLLLTNDGALARALELPATGWLRRYRVRVHGSVDEAALARLKDGITIDGIRYGAVAARLERTIGSNAWVEIGIREGKNREVRKLLDHLGLTVTRLIRVGFGPFPLGDLAPGTVVEVPRHVMRTQLGSLLPGHDPKESPASPKRPAPARRRHADHRRTP